MSKFARSLLLLLAAAAVSLAAVGRASASQPFCNIAEQTEIMFEGNWFGVSWLGSPQLSRAFVAWPLDERSHWAVYELWMEPESFEKTGEHKGWGLLTELPAETWKAGQLIVILEEQSAQGGHSPSQIPPADHGRLLVILGLIPNPDKTEIPPVGAPLCKIPLEPVIILERP
ncbi:MAG: hypothetical protein WD751_11820 [Anaerolineales bacterium]